MMGNPDPVNRPMAPPRKTTHDHLQDAQLFATAARDDLDVGDFAEAAIYAALAQASATAAVATATRDAGQRY